MAQFVGARRRSTSVVAPRLCSAVRCCVSPGRTYPVVRTHFSISRQESVETSRRRGHRSSRLSRVTRSSRSRVISRATTFACTAEPSTIRKRTGPKRSTSVDRGKPDTSDPVMSVHGDLGVIALDESLGFDLQTGEQRWVHGYSTCSTAHTSSDGVTLVSDGGCEGNGRPTSEYALDQYGREFARTDELPSESSYYGGRYSRDDPAGRSTPIILGHSGFDRTSGEKLWSNSELFDTAQSLAVIGNVVAVTRSGSEPEVQFVDLLTGEVLWRSNAERAGEVVWHGDVVIDEGNVYGTDVRTGQRSWEDSGGPGRGRRVHALGDAARAVGGGEGAVAFQ